MVAPPLSGMEGCKAMYSNTLAPALVPRTTWPNKMERAPMDLREEGRDAGREGEEKKVGGGGRWEGEREGEEVLQFLCTFEWFEWLPRKT